MHRLRNVMKHYAWGSPTAIPDLLGAAPDGRPVAELWMGAHSAGSSELAATGERLDDVLTARSATLPFLFKVLAADHPLSLQAHPNLAQAQAGFAREEAAGIALAAPERNYKDANHKPELICALTPFHALCGFRDVAATRELLAAIDCDPLTRICAGRELREMFAAIMSAGPALVDAVVAACVGGGPFARETAMVRELGARHPGDPGVVIALLLNFVELVPGEAIYLPAGNLHAYLRGAGLELMASSDNVLRGGLTPKHVDVAELMRVLDFRAGPVAIIKPTPVDAWQSVYRTDAREFELACLVVDASGPPAIAPRGPEIWLVTDGAIEADGELLVRGDSVFVSDTEDEVRLRGAGTLYRATTGA